MVRESKMIFKARKADAVNIECFVRDDNEPWRRQGVIPRLGTMAEVIKSEVETLERFGWTLYDIEDGNTLTCWKEF